ncbi:glycosyltransferase [Egicoccus sp. AB-alg2]|uniref:glycosyltransferase n=1 Tax=Egicoccus sp. AB-alg2 TaxID=3242693 RepID=UPI00359ECB21
MSRIAVVSGPDAGHALPTLGVASALAERGHEVVFCSGAGHAALAAAHGCAFRELPQLAPTSQDGDLGHLLWTRGADMAVALADALSIHPPDLVVADVLTNAGGFAAQLLGRPWVEVVPHHLPDPAPDLPPVGLGRAPARHPLRRLDDRRIHVQQQRSLALGRRQAAAAARRIGLDRRVEPLLRLVATLPALERRRRAWPERVHVVGPLAVEPDLPPLAPPEGDEPLVVVTDSTATGVSGGLGRTALAGLCDLDVRLVVTSGDLHPRAGQRLVVGRGPHAPLLAGAALAVGPGGGGFVSKAAAAGVPLVVVPLQGDQREAAARLREAGVASVLAPARLSPRRLRWRVARALADPRPRVAVRRLAAQASHLGPHVAAALVEQVLAGERPAAGGPDAHLPVALVSPARQGPPGRR